jgi:hypothetical protein
LDGAIAPAATLVVGLFRTTSTKEIIMLTKCTRIIAPILVSLLLAPALSQAESGTSEFIGSFVTNYTKAEFEGTTYTAGGSVGTLTVTHSSGAPFVDGSSGAIDCAVAAKQSTAGLDLEANCVVTFSPQDKMLWVSKRKSGSVTVGSPGEGVTTIVGGTGRFSNIQGDCTYKINPVGGNRLVTVAQCKWVH